MSVWGKLFGGGKKGEAAPTPQEAIQVLIYIFYASFYRHVMCIAVLPQPKDLNHGSLAILKTLGVISSNFSLYFIPIRTKMI